jgi:hypothetical protein
MEVPTLEYKYLWLGKTNVGEIPQWDLDKCINYLGFSECKQITLAGDGTAANKRELVYHRFMHLITNYKHTDDSESASDSSYDCKQMVYNVNFARLLVSRVFPGLKLPPVSIIDANSTDPNVRIANDVETFRQNVISILRVLYKDSII